MGSIDSSYRVSRRRVLQVGLLGSAAILATACGGQQAASGGPSQVPATTSSSAAAPSPTAAQMSAAAAATATALPIEAVQVNKSAGVVQLVYWNAWTGLFEDMVHRLVNSFNKSHDKIQVTPQVIPSADFDTKFLTAVTAGDPPDVAMLWNSTGRLYTMAEQGAVTPLEEVIDDPNMFKEWVLPYIWELGTYKGKLYVSPNGCRRTV